MLAELAPNKEFAGSTWGQMAWAADLTRRDRAEGRRVARSLTTQFVVGAIGESDRELLGTVDRAHRDSTSSGPTSAHSTQLSTRPSPKRSSGVPNTSYASIGTHDERKFIALKESE